MWQDLVDRRMAFTCGLDDLDETLGRRIVIFGLLVCLTPSFAESVCAGKWPYISKELLRRWECGSAPLLSYDEIAQANAGDGVHILNVHSGIPQAFWHPPYYHEGPMSEEVKQILDQNEATFTSSLAGFNLNEVILEAYGNGEREYGLGMEFVDREGLKSALDAVAISPDRQHFPYVIGLNRYEVANKRGTAVGSWFRFAPPQLGLGFLEQELLHFAMTGATDDELADTLSISHATVRKRWTSIFDKVEAFLPSLFERTKGGRIEATRTVGKRRAVIQYVQNHRQKLRPWAPSKQM